MLLFGRILLLTSATALQVEPVELRQVQELHQVLEQERRRV